MSSPSTTSSPALSERSAKHWFEQEVHPHGGQLKSWLSGSFPGVRSEVDDVVQESYLKIWKRQAVQPIASAKAFLFIAARNIAIDWLRRGRRSPIDLYADPDLGRAVVDDAPNAIEILSMHERYQLLVQAVAALPPRCREVVLWHKFRGLSQREVATKLQISERTVEVHVRNAVRHCETFLRGQGVCSLRD
ncbi:RNA polymerase sigma factor [Actomonas aquatica]|uniref:RNA polymerase sigma factor n=1 Tax=Actomonas aquatica TaxID=2866162 RepID=A0ABZ1C639_9BACT|nr:RNA polymerase sigma factor [Opitutus sp. WL0086]WRQ85770.1 RNA polymerase sigma factor [Opitutus sp. WL0086]